MKQVLSQFHLKKNWGKTKENWDEKEPDDSNDY